MADSPKSDDNSIDVNPIDILIIKRVEKNKILYDSSCYVDEGYKFSNLMDYKKMVFESISKKILDRFDKEMTPEDVKKRWLAIRRSFSRSLNSGSTYYLHDYLKFLLPHMKISKKKVKAYVHKPHVPLHLSPIQEISSDDENDEIIQDNKRKKEDVRYVKSEIKSWIPELDLLGKNDGAADEHFVEEKVESTSTNLSSSLNCNNAESDAEASTSREKQDNATWNWVCETQFMNDLKVEFTMIDYDKQLICMSEIFEAIYFYTFTQK